MGKEKVGRKIGNPKCFRGRQNIALKESRIKLEAPTKTSSENPI